MCEAVEQLDKALLKNAEDELRHHQKIKNSHVNCLLKEVSIMSHRHSFSNESKMNSRHKCKTLMLQDCVANIWFTLNLNDLTNPACIKLAVYHKSDMSMTREILNSLIFHVRQTIHSHFVNHNSVSTVLFFKIQIDAFFKHLIRVNKTGCFDKISNYFATVKTNDQGVLHLHDLL